MALLLDPAAIEREATVADIGAVAEYLQARLGQKLTAYLAGVRDPKMVGRWARGTQPRDTPAMRLRAAFQATRMLTDAYGDRTAKAWFVGSNTRLDDEAPAWVLRYAQAPDDLRFVVPAARAFAGAADWSAPRRVWRLGHVDDPLGFVPRELSSWQHRWDDPRREYRTLYCATRMDTCLAEVLADLRPSTRMLDDLAKVMGPAPEVTAAAGLVDTAWRATHALAPARPRLEADLHDVEDLEARAALERRHARLLAAYGIDHLDISELRSRTRAVTQAVGRDLFERGWAGVAFSSNVDGGPCFALFEGRAVLAPAGAPIVMSDDIRVLERVCAELGLRLARA